MAKFQAQIFKINDIVGWNARHELKLAPGFQRRKVWTLKGKSFLIDSILRGMPLPQFFIRETVLPKEKRTVREVVDGQQRLSTILSFIEGGFTVLPIHNREFASLKFEELAEEVQRRFLFYPLSVNVLEGADDADVLEIFARLNSYTEPLNQQEKLNARYVGAFKGSIDELARQHLNYWRRHEILSERFIARMRDVELTCELVGAMLYGLQGGKKVIVQMYEEFDAGFEQFVFIEPRFAETLQFCERIVGGDLSVTIFRRPAIFYSLFAAAYDLRHGFQSGADAPVRMIVEAQTPIVQDGLLRLSEAIANDEREGEYGDFYLAARQSTDKLPQRTVRHERIVNILQPIFANQ